MGCSVTEESFDWFASYWRNYSHELRWELQGDVFVIDEYYQFKATEPDDPEHNPNA